MINKIKSINAQELFLEKIVMQKTISASFSRANIYSKSFDPYLQRRNAKENFKQDLSEAIIEISKDYKKLKVSDDEHIKNIEMLSLSMSRKHNSILRNGFRVGIAQKALNLYLKFQWCLNNDHHLPPHCPYDSIVIAKLPFDYKWTKICSIDIYKELVKASRFISKKEGYDSISEWELELWNNAE